MAKLMPMILAEAQGLDIILLMGIAVFCGTVGARIFQRLGVPQIIAYVTIGVLLGDCLGWITSESIETLEPFTMFALGMIGFMIGGELRSDVFKKYGRQFFIILISQGIGAFLLAAVGTAVVMWFVTANVYVSVAMGLVLGAIASATAPAATINVLWEYKTRGVLTAAVLAIVALDDALALVLYRVSATAADAIMGTGNSSVLTNILLLFGEIVGSILLGIMMGLLLCYLLRFVRSDDKILGFSIALLLLISGISTIYDVDPILPAMTFGITIANVTPRRSKGIFELVRKFSPPIYTVFFVLAGAHMEFSSITAWMVVMVVVYTLCRATGKIVGSALGARYSGAADVVRKYLGICLLPQAGVAIGMAILAGRQFNTELGKIIVMVVMTATFIMEIIGPMLVKLGVKKAGEVGMNVTEEDLIKTYTVADIMNTNPTTIAQDLPLQEVLEVFSTSDSVYYPVIDSQSRITSIITIADIKEMFANRDVAGWLLACDVSEPVLDKITPGKPLEDAVEWMKRYDLENIPVVADDGSDRLVGVLDYRKTLRKISAEVLHRRKAADQAALPAG